MTSSPPKRARIRKMARIPLICVACLVALYLVLVLAGGGWSPRLDDTFAWQGDSVLLFAHRGVDLSVPENSEASLAEARRVGFQAVEIDVRKTKDGELVLFHDRTARRMLGLEGKFSELTWDRVKGCKLLFDGRATTNSVPTLREVFQKFGETLRFYLDMKDRGFKDADQIVALIDEFGLYDQTILASVDPFFVAYVEHKYPKVNTVLERFDIFQVYLYRLIPKRWKPDYLSGLASEVTPGHVEWLKKEQLLSKRIVYSAGGTQYDRVLNLGIPKAIVDYDPSVHSRVLSQPIAVQTPDVSVYSRSTSDNSDHENRPPVPPR
jgi:glycerophosphoryl diester phosphodiesterase